MTAITAQLVNELRKLTEAPLMQCKQALVEANGNIELAIENMRKAGMAKAAKKAGRIAAEGIILVIKSADNKLALIAEINCETDFVGRDENFTRFAHEVAQAAFQHKEIDPAKIANIVLPSGNTVEQARQELVNKLGENILLRRFEMIHGGGIVADYSHHGRIAVLVALDKSAADLGKDLAMHIAASNPQAITADQVSKELIEKEREIAFAQAEQSGKPKEILEKMVQGRISKYLKEITLVDQAFVKNPDQLVGDLLKQHQVKVEKFIRFEVGEGIEKPVEDFAAAVREQVGN